jgi:hypothetical protein
VWIAEQADHLGHGWLKDSAVFGVGYAVHGEGLTIAEEGVEDAVAVAMS